jgi:SAM-dependent methyltransferase
MRLDHLVHLACPRCRTPLEVAEATERADDRIVEGTLRCTACRATWPVLRSIPRFVDPSNYAASFGRQWERFPRTLYDRHNGLTLYRDRFFRASGWPRDLRGEIVLEAGCGPGAFTEIVVSTGATIVSFDLSSAVDVDFRENGANPNLLIVQGDVMQPPVRAGAFDRVFCFGVLQHTPDPRASFRQLVPLAKPGGSLAIDCYRKLERGRWWRSYYRMRPLTRRMPPALVHALCRAWVVASWPIVTTLWKLPGDGGRNFARYVFLIRDTFRRKQLPVTPAFEREWAVMQLVDQLTAHFDLPQTIDAVQGWFEEAGLERIDVAKGDNGIVGRAVRSKNTPLPAGSDSGRGGPAAAARDRR